MVISFVFFIESPHRTSSCGAENKRQIADEMGDFKQTIFIIY